nr:reverse transcriptase domain-containing protein [Tanacetum cinerariifolium]
MTATLKQFQATPPTASVKAVEEICVTCGGAHPYYQCLAVDGNTFPELQDNIQGYVSADAVNYNQGNSGYRPLGVANQIQPPGFAQPNVQNNQNRFSQPQGYNRANNFNQNQSYQASTQRNQVVPLTFMSNQTNELKNMMANFFQMNTASTSGSRSLPSNTIANPKEELKAITTRSGIVFDGCYIPIPPPFINLEDDERVEENLTDQDLAKYTIKRLSSRSYLRNLETLGNFSFHVALELKYKALADLGSSINLMPFCVWKKLGLPELIYTRMTLKLANRAICTPAGIVRDVFFLVGKFTFPADFVIVDYESDPRVPLILERHFLRTTRALIDVHGKKMILRDGDERSTLNMRHDTSSYSNQPQKQSINMINIFNDSSEDFLKNLFTTNHQSGNPTFSSHLNLTSPKVKDDIFYPEGGSVLIEKLLDLDSTKDPCEKLLNINLPIAKIKSLNDNATPGRVLKPLSPSPIPIEDSDSFLDKSDTSLSYSDNSLPEFENFINHTEETNSGSTTTHADYSLPKYDSFLFKIEPDQGKLTIVVMKDKVAEPRVLIPNVLTTYPTLMLDSDFIPSDNSLPEFKIFYFDIEEKNSGSTTIHDDISLSDLGCFDFKPDPCELTSIVDSGIRKNVLFATHVNLPPEEDHSPLFAYVVWIFLSFLMYPMVPPNLLSFENEDTIFDPDISNYHFPSLLPDVSHRCETFMKFNVYPKLLNEVRWRFYLPLDPPWSNEFEDWVKLSDPKQVLRGRHPMLILVLVMNKCIAV